MAVELLDSPPVHAIITANKELLFHLPEVAKVILKKPVPSVLKAIGSSLVAAVLKVLNPRGGGELFRSNAGVRIAATTLELSILTLVKCG